MFQFTRGDFKLSSVKDVNSVTFDISRYGMYTKTLTFNDFLSEKEAIEQVEEYLSQPLTREWYEKVKDDLYFDTYENYFEDSTSKPCRGDLLTSLIYLDDIMRIDKSHIRLRLGS